MSWYLDSAPLVIRAGETRSEPVTIPVVAQDVLVYAPPTLTGRVRIGVAMSPDCPASLVTPSRYLAGGEVCQGPRGGYTTLWLHSTAVEAEERIGTVSWKREGI